MAPVTKFWLSTLKEGSSMVQTAFSGSWLNAITRTTEYTSDGDHHFALYQCDQEPDMLTAIVGYPSARANINSEEMARNSNLPFFEYVVHKELYILDMDVSELPLSSDKIAILFSESQPAGADSLPGKGEWGAPSQTLPFEPPEGWATEIRTKNWIHVAPSEDADQLSQAGVVRTYTKIIESHVASESRE